MRQRIAEWLLIMYLKLTRKQLISVQATSPETVQPSEPFDVFDEDDEEDDFEDEDPDAELDEADDYQDSKDAVTSWPAATSFRTNLNIGYIVYCTRYKSDYIVAMSNKQGTPPNVAIFSYSDGELVGSMVLTPARARMLGAYILNTADFADGTTPLNYAQ